MIDLHDIMRAHQFLYYVEGQPIWSDYEYDRWCAERGLFGGGGSDMRSSYEPRIIELAQQMREHPEDFRP